MIETKFDLVMFGWLCFITGYTIPMWIDLTQSIWREYVDSRKSKRTDESKTKD